MKLDYITVRGPLNFRLNYITVKGLFKSLNFI